VFGDRYAHRIAEIWRYYKIGLINTAFGLGLYFGLVFLGLNIFVAQLISHFTGVVFNYFMFTAHVFKGVRANIFAYVVSYGLNYLLGLGLLAGYHQVIKSPYLAGFLATFTASAINYVMLKLFVFRRAGDRA
jgi:putative flippase GtrA